MALNSRQDKTPLNAIKISKQFGTVNELADRDTQSQVCTTKCKRSIQDNKN
eukprot:m.45494 g.45494  ORF g.45494 m.45494 type:complete len:51 (-) comp12182_c0_seq1:621-773(-)